MAWYRKIYNEYNEIQCALSLSLYKGSSIVSVSGMIKPGKLMAVMGAR